MSWFELVLGILGLLLAVLDARRHAALSALAYVLVGVGFLTAALSDADWLERIGYGVAAVGFGVNLVGGVLGLGRSRRTEPSGDTSGP